MMGLALIHGYIPWQVICMIGALISFIGQFPNEFVKYLTGLSLFSTAALTLVLS